MSLASGTSSADQGGWRRPGSAGSRQGLRVGMLVAASMTLLLAATTVAQSPSVEPSPSPAAATTPTLEGTQWVLHAAASPGVAALASAPVASSTSTSASAPVTSPPAPVTSPPAASSQVTMLLQDGQASGNDGCNDYFAPYTLSGSALAFGQIGVSFPPATCPAESTTFEEAYFAAVASTSSYTLVGSTLTLVDGTGAPVLAYTAMSVSPVIGSWVVTGYRNRTHDIVVPDERTQLTLVLEPNGTAHGHTGCGQFTGGYTVDGNAITIGPLVVTATRCSRPGLQRQAKQYIRVLKAARSWVARDGGLKLLKGNGRTVVSLAPAQAAPMVGAWTPTGIMGSDGTLTPPVDGSDPTLDFLAGGDLNGWTGCNQLFGSYEVAGDAIDIGPLGTTRAACSSDALATQETGYLAALDRTATWTLDAQGLKLLDAEGATQVTLAPAPNVILLPTASPKPTATPTPSPSPKPTAKPTPSPSPKPTAKPSDALNDTKWILTRYDDGSGDVIDLPVQAETPTAAFVSGSMGGFAGCNTYTGTYSLDGSSIKVGPFAMSGMRCDDLATAVESIYISSLGQVKTWKLSSDKGTLTLTGDAGGPVLTFGSPLK